MKIIDFEKKGNVVRFWLGADDLQEWWGDDWNDAPYDCNAGSVYEQYVSGHKDIAFPFDDRVIEPCEGAYNCICTKEDMIKRYVPCIIVVPNELVDDSCWHGQDFAHWAVVDGIQRYYFGDRMEAEDEEHKNAQSGGRVD